VVVSSAAAGEPPDRSGVSWRFGTSLSPRAPNTYTELEDRASLVAVFTPVRDGSELPFNLEAIYSPFHDLSRYERPGPTIKIYALRPS
jgi:hypothetical protein